MPQKLRIPAKHQQSVLLTSPQLADLQAEAMRLGLPVADVVRRIIDAWREPRAGMQQSRQEDAR